MASMHCSSARPGVVYSEDLPRLILDFRSRAEEMALAFRVIALDHNENVGVTRLRVGSS